MEIKELYESLGEKKDQLLLKAAQCKSTDELISLASENNLSIDKETAQKILELVSQKNKVLLDDELDMVAGGKGDYHPQGDLKYTCDGDLYLNCPRCNSGKLISSIDIGGKMVKADYYCSKRNAQVTWRL